MSGWVAGAVVVGGLASAAIGANASQNAAQTQANAATNAQGISQNEFNTITAQQQPFIQSGYGSLGQLDYLLGNGPQGGNTGTGPIGQPPPVAGGPGGAAFGGGRDPRGDAFSGGPPTPGAVPPVASGSTAGGFGSLLKPFDASNFQQLSPAYQFQKEQGTQGVLNADASGAGALSGSSLKDLMSFNQNLANTSFNQAFNQYQTQQGNIFSRLSGLAQLGQAAATNTGQQGTALAGQAAQSATNIGTAQAAGQIGAANAWSGGLQSVAPWIGQFSGGPSLDATGLGTAYQTAIGPIDTGLGH